MYVKCIDYTVRRKKIKTSAVTSIETNRTGSLAFKQIEVKLISSFFFFKHMNEGHFQPLTEMCNPLNKLTDLLSLNICGLARFPSYISLYLYVSFSQTMSTIYDQQLVLLY